MVVHDLWLEVFEDLFQGVVTDVVLVELDGWVKIGGIASRQVVDNGHLVAFGAKAVGDVRANEARTAGDKNTHGQSLAISVRYQISAVSVSWRPRRADR